MSVARRLRVAVKMTDCPPGTGTEVSPALAPDPEEPVAFDTAGKPRACAGMGAATAPPPAAVRFAAPLIAEPPAEQPAASRQAPTVSRSVQAAARRGRDRGAVKRVIGAVMPMGRQPWHAGSHRYVTTWQLYWLAQSSAFLASAG